MGDWAELVDRFQGLIGVIVGAIIALVTNTVAENHRIQHEKRQSREREYLKVIDSTHTLKMALGEMMRNAQSQAELLRDTEDKTEEARLLDAEGVKIVDKLFHTVRMLEQHRDHIRVFGSPSVIAAHEAMIDSIWGYMRSVGESTLENGRVYYDDYKRELSDLRKKLDDLIEAIRNDLGYQPPWPYRVKRFVGSRIHAFDKRQGSDLE